MTHAPRADTTQQPARVAMRPLYFDSGAHSLFGWLHRRSDCPHRDVGVVICKPFGYEAMCAHRSVRRFAEECAALGAPTLRFDYLGTADSPGIEPTANQLEIWTDDVIAGVAALKRHTGVSRVCLLGIRLGALLAGLAMNRCPAVDSLILIAPILSGQRYLKQIHVTRLAASLTPGSTDDSAPPGSVEIGGFVLSVESLAALSRVDLESQPAPAVRAMLIIDGSSLPAARGWADRLADTGVPVTYRALPGLVEMVFTAPQFAALPRAMLTSVRDWLTDRVLKNAPLFRTDAASSPPSAEVSLPLAAGRWGSPTERPAFLGLDAILFGIVTEPGAGERRRRGALILNAGADPHVGPSDISVTLARAWAHHGYIVLRLDLGGLGDSATRSGRPDDDVFPPAAIEDMRAALAYLRGRYGLGDITVVGMCSGAYHALQCAMAGLPVDRLLMVNPQNFVWKDDMSIHGMQLAELVTSAARAGNSQRRLMSLEFWRRVVTGNIDGAYVASRAIRRACFRVTSASQELIRRLGIRRHGDLGSALEEIARRGLQIVFVFARNEPGIRLLQVQAGCSLQRLGERLEMHVIDGADHVFSKRGPRLQLQQILSNELYRRVRPSIAAVGTQRRSAAGA